MIIAWAIEAARQKEWRHFAKAFGVVLAGGLVAIAINSTSLYHTYQYSQETMRGGREITLLSDDKAKRPQARPRPCLHHPSGATASTRYSLSSSPTPKVVPQDTSERQVQREQYLNPQIRQVVAQQNRYWGDQPFTAEASLCGCLCTLVAIFGVCVAKGPMKWSLLAVTLLTITLIGDTI